jgi:hypothetical protein
MTCSRRVRRGLADLTPNLSNLEETGRLQFFYHSPSSRWPVRDVLNELGYGFKTEPHIEKGAENYCTECVPKNIRGFLKRSEKYLFLFTRCANRELGSCGKLFVVGYITKEGCERRPGGFYAATGTTRLYSFGDAYPLRSNQNPRQMRKILGRKETARILDHLEGRRNILDKCLMEIRKLKKRLPSRERKGQERACR